MNIIKWKLASFKKRVKYLRKAGMKVGDGCEIYSHTDFGSEPYLISLGDYVRITNGVRFITHDGGIWVLRNMKLLENGDFFGQIKVGNNVHIGMDSIIMPGVNIGNNCIIGCGAVVTKNIPNNSVAVGVPAKVIQSIEEYYNKNKDRCSFTKHLNYQDKKAFLNKKYNFK